MRVWMLLACLLLPFVWRFAEVAAEEPKIDTFRSDEGKFSINFPAKPTKKPYKVNSVDSMQLLVTHNGNVYLANYTNYPKGAFEADSIEKRLEEGRDRAVGDDGKLISDMKISIGKKMHTGREFIVKKPKIHIRTRVYFVGDQVLNVMIAGTLEFVNSKVAVDFLDSFKIDEK